MTTKFITMMRCQPQGPYDRKGEYFERLTDDTDTLKEQFDAIEEFEHQCKSSLGRTKEHSFALFIAEFDDNTGEIKQAANAGAIVKEMSNRQDEAEEKRRDELTDSERDYEDRASHAEMKYKSAKEDAI